MSTAKYEIIYFCWDDIHSIIQIWLYGKARTIPQAEECLRDCIQLFDKNKMLKPDGYPKAQIVQVKKEVY